MRFHNQLAVVTGAAQGIGAAVVQQLLAQGARVALLDRNEQQLRDFYQTLNSDVCSMYVVDVADAQAVERCIEQVENTQGVIGLLANVAGILHLDSLLDGSMSHWLDTFSVNTHGVFYVSRAVGRRMQARGEGAIVTVASNASNTPRLNMGAYAASKAAGIGIGSRRGALQRRFPRLDGNGHAAAIVALTTGQRRGVARFAGAVSHGDSIAAHRTAGGCGAGRVFPFVRRGQTHHHARSARGWRCDDLNRIGCNPRTAAD